MSLSVANLSRRSTSVRLDDLQTPALILERPIMMRNIERMAARAHALGVPLRPHGKTPKNVEIARLLVKHGAVGLTLSTLREAEAYFAGGIVDLFYAVALAPQKVARAARLIAAGAKLLCATDTVEAAQAVAIAARGANAVIPLVIELDVDGYRGGVCRDDPEFLEIARILDGEDGVALAGIMSYGGASYGLKAADAAQLAETHRTHLIETQAMLGDIGLSCPIVSFGSSPAVLHAATMAGMTELRCGIYVFQDLFQAVIGACEMQDIALSVLATVIGVRPDLNRVIVDAGGLAMSKDLSTARTVRDLGYGLVCDLYGRIVPDVFMSATSQELGLITTFSGASLPFASLAIGTRVRILPNHADMTASAYDGYHVVDGDTQVQAFWQRANGW